MVQIQTFDSFEEMQDAERKARTKADSQVQWWQARVRKGDCFKQWTEYGFYIFGEVLEEYEEEYLKNYRFCDCFSEGCPEGEIGDVHVSQITALISKDELEAVKKVVRQK